MHSRRDFLKLLSMAVGVTLSGCGEGTSQTAGGSPVDPLLAPMAYGYRVLVRSGQDLPSGRSFQARSADGEPPFMGAVMLNDRRHIYFHALDEANNRGIYRLDLDEAGAPGEITNLIREGSVLADGTVVADFSDGEINNSDDLLVAVEDANGVTTLQYAQNGGGFRPLAKSFGELSGNVKLAGYVCQTQSIADDGSILFVADYLDSDGICEGEGLFLMPSGQPDQTRLLLANEQLVPGTSSAIQTFDVCELGPGGLYLVRGSASATAGLASADANGKPLTYLLAGRLGETPRLVAIDPALGSPGQGYALASSFMCPRIGYNSEKGSMTLGAILQLDENRTQLWLDDQVLIEADLAGGGSRSPQGSRIVSILPPVFGPRGLVYFQVFTEDGMELLLYDGVNTRTLLSRGDDFNGQKIETILFGSLPEAVNSHGEFVTIVELSDGETDILLGYPI